MSIVARVRLAFDGAGATRTLTKMRRDAGDVQDAFEGLPGSVRQANSELISLARTYVRVGHLRRKERQEFRDHQTFVKKRHTETVDAHRKVSNEIAGHAQFGAYTGHVAAGTLGPAMAASEDLRSLHEKVMDRDRMQREISAYEHQARFVDEFASGGGRFGAARAAGSFLRGQAFGRHDDGAPKNLRQWASSAVGGTARRFRTGARRLGGLFMGVGAIQGARMSLNAYESEQEAIHTIGVRLGAAAEGMGGSFKIAGDRIEGLRKSLKFTLGEMRPGLMTMARFTGGLARAEAAATFARYRGTDLGGTTGAIARMMQYGDVGQEMINIGGASVQSPLFARTQRGTGYMDRPELFLSTMEAIQSSLGRGQAEVGEGQADRYMGLLSGAFGAAYKNERGRQLITSLIGGMTADSSGLVRHARMRAVGRLGKIDLGGKIGEVDTRTVRGARMALESGHPDVAGALFEQAMELGADGPMGKQMLQSLFQIGGRGKTIKSEMLFNYLKSTGGKVPSLEDVRRETGISVGDTRAVEDTEAYKIAKLRAEMESDVLLRIGEKLLPTVIDFKQMALEFTRGLVESADTMRDFTGFLGGINEAVGSARDVAMDSPNRMTRPLAEFAFFSQFDTWLSAVMARGAVEAGNLLRDDR